MNNKEFRDRLVNLRLSKNCSARKLSLMLGKSDNYIQEIESGKNMPPMPVFFEICDYFEITPSQFFDFGDSFEKISLHNEIDSLTDKEIALVAHIIEGIKKYKK
jgi:transcriptional regulator with XRE-family HTH domain